MEIDETLPEVVKGFLRKGYTLERIRLDANGKWTHEGLDFENQRIIDLFSRSVSRTAGGTWVLVIPPFTYPIEVDDTGYFVTSINPALGQVKLSDDSVELLDLDSLRYEPDGRLYCRVKNGAFEARFLRHAYYAMANLLNVDDEPTIEWMGTIHEAKWALNAD